MKKRYNKPQIEFYIKAHGHEIFKKCVDKALDGDGANQRFLIENFVSSKIKLKGSTPMELIQSLVQESRKPNLPRAEIDQAIKVIKTFCEVYELHSIEKRLTKLEKANNRR